MIYLDMDGPLCDFIGAMLRVHGREDLLADYPNGQLIYGHHLGMSDAQMIAGVEAEGVGFWTELGLQPWAERLVAMCEACCDVELATDANFGDWAASGKRIWLRNHFGGRFLSTVHMTSRKYRLAHKHAILIDDHDKNVKAFIDAGGEAILWPMPWNNGWLGHDTPEAKLAHVERELERIGERKRWLVGKR